MQRQWRSGARRHLGGAVPRARAGAWACATMEGSSLLRGKRGWVAAWRPLVSRSSRGFGLVGLRWVWSRKAARGSVRRGRRGARPAAAHVPGSGATRVNLLLYFPSAGLAPHHLGASGHGTKKQKRKQRAKKKSEKAKASEVWGGKSGSPAARLEYLAAQGGRPKASDSAAGGAPTFSNPDNSSPTSLLSPLTFRFSLLHLSFWLLALAFHSVAADLAAVWRVAC